MFDPFLGDTHEDGEGFEFKGWDQIKDETFVSYLKLLIKRCTHLKTLKPNSLDYDSYRDLCLVMLRAIVIENKNLSNNFTVQNFLIRHGRSDLANEINLYMNQEINKEYTVRTIIKTCVDKFIVHNDAITKIEDKEENLDVETFVFRHLFLSDIANENFPFTISKIVHEILRVVSQVIDIDSIDANTIVG